MSNVKKFEDFEINEGEGYSTMGNTGDMGAVVSAQPSAIPGDVRGSTTGSGDIGSTLGTYTKAPAYASKKKKNKKQKMHNLIEFSQFNEDVNYTRYGNSVKKVKKVQCTDCGARIEDSIASKKAHVYSKHWSHPTRTDDEANKLVNELFPR